MIAACASLSITCRAPGNYQVLFGPKILLSHEARKHVQRVKVARENRNRALYSSEVSSESFSLRKDSAEIQNIFCFCLFDCFAFRIKEELSKKTTSSTRPSITLGFLPFLLKKPRNLLYYIDRPSHYEGDTEPSRSRQKR